MFAIVEWSRSFKIHMRRNIADSFQKPRTNIKHFLPFSFWQHNNSRANNSEWQIFFSRGKNCFSRYIMKSNLKRWARQRHTHKSQFNAICAINLFVRSVRSRFVVQFFFCHLFRKIEILKSLSDFPLLCIFSPKKSVSFRLVRCKWAIKSKHFGRKRFALPTQWTTFKSAHNISRNLCNQTTIHGQRGLSLYISQAVQQF